MFKKLLVALSLSTFLTSLSFAEDLLAFYTNGKLTENSPGVKVLSLEEKKSVKGGYMVIPKHNGIDEYYVIARYTSGEANYILNYANNLNAPKGLCGMNQATCNNPSSNRFTSFLEVTGNHIDFFPVYYVKRNIGISNLGNKFVYFTYGVGVADDRNKIYKFSSSPLLNNNMIIKEMANKYKEQMESALGGWNIR